MLKVLLLSDFTSAYSRLLLKGFLRYSMEVGNWRFYRIPLSREDFNDEKAIETVIDIAQRWGADAIMGQLSEVNTERLRPIGIPVILQNYPNRVDGISNITGEYTNSRFHFIWSFCTNIQKNLLTYLFVDVFCSNR